MLADFRPSLLVCSPSRRSLASDRVARQRRGIGPRGRIRDARTINTMHDPPQFRSRRATQTHQCSVADRSARRRPMRQVVPPPPLVQSVVSPATAGQPAPPSAPSSALCRAAPPDHSRFYDSSARPRWKTWPMTASIGGSSTVRSATACSESNRPVIRAISRLGTRKWTRPSSPFGAGVRSP